MKCRGGCTSGRGHDGEQCQQHGLCFSQSLTNFVHPLFTGASPASPASPAALHGGQLMTSEPRVPHGATRWLMAQRPGVPLVEGEAVAAVAAVAETRRRADERDEQTSRRVEQ